MPSDDSRVISRECRDIKAKKSRSKEKGAFPLVSFETCSVQRGISDYLHDDSVIVTPTCKREIEGRPRENATKI